MSALTINYAVYGHANACIDVTQSVIRIVSTGNDDIYVAPYTFGIPFDPASGITKVFVVSYNDTNGTQKIATGIDGDTIDLVP